MGRLLTTFKDKTFEPSMKSYYQLYTDDTSTAAQIYDSLLYVRGINAGSLAKNQEGDNDVSTVENYDTYMPVRFYNIKSVSDGATPAGPTHTFFNVYNRSEYNGPDGQNMYDLWADYNIAKLSGAGYITNTIGGAYNYGYDAGSGDDQTIPGIYGALNYTRIQPTGDNRTVTYAQGARNWIQVNKTDATVTFAYPTTSEFNLTDGNVGTVALHKFDLDYTAGNITNAYFIWADESSLPTPSGEKYFIKSNIGWPTLLSGALTNTGAVTFNSTLSVSGTATLSSNVNIGGNLVVTGTSTFNGGTITIGDAASDNVVFGADVDSHIIPDDDNTYDLGSPTQEWRNLYIDGTAYVDVLSLSNHLDLSDNLKIRFGNSQDLQIYHDGSNSYIEGGTTSGAGNIIIRTKDSRDLIFQGDNGDGDSSSTTYFQLDTSMANTGNPDVYTRFPDNSRLTFGNSANANSLDLEIYHEGTASYIKNGATNFNIESKNGIYIENKTASDINITNSADDGDIIFYSDNGSGGLAEYFRLDGGNVRTLVGKPFRFSDNVELQIGNVADLIISHDSNDSTISNNTGDLIIKNRADDKDIIFQSDDGSGGVTEYFRLDGSDGNVKVSKQFAFLDNVIASFGNAADLQISHDGSNSFIQDVGTGNLFIEAVSSIQFRKYNTAEFMARFINDAAVELY